MKAPFFTDNVHPEFIDAQYEDYRKNPFSVSPEWRHFFEGFELASSAAAPAVSSEFVQKESKVLSLIEDYRRRGHLFTKTNPVRERRNWTPTLALENFGLSESDLDTTFQAGSEIGIGPATLRAIVDHLKTTYCGSIGSEYMYIPIPEKLDWVQKRMESTRNTPQFSIDDKKHILHKLNQAVVFENFLHTKYIGQKRFALSGGETLIPGLDAIIEKGAELGIREFVIGMAHRGRLNVLANIMQQPMGEIFSKFEGEDHADSDFEGDVKYHLGYSSDVLTRSGQTVHLDLIPNPSHLEAVNPVVEGVVHSKIKKRYNGDRKMIAPILIHGDAALAGQGVAYEVIQMSQLKAFHTGGTIHLVINNQIGFTTNYLDGRSSIYCTDIGKVTFAPIFHVNAEDVEAVVYAIQLAMEYRQRYHADVFIDLLSYRKYGHNEADEPRFTQPKLYKAIAERADARQIYFEKLLKNGSVSKTLAEDMEEEFQQMLSGRLRIVREEKPKQKDFEFRGDWKDFRSPKEEDFLRSPDTAVDEATLLRVGERVLSIPEDVHVYSKIRKLYDGHMARLTETRRLDWALGELLAYGTLLDEGIPVRLCGQDSQRGTFSHRHSVLIDEQTEETYVPLNNISPSQAEFQVVNSLLSEYAVLGFEYGYAWGNPKGLGLWEAQFGDFVNGAQIIIDQFLSCAETKWRHYNGLVLLLPHGYEGQGPEHSSARPERLYNLCAHNNMQVVNPSTPANFFHLLRRQMKFPFRIPLVVLTPKSLLRHPDATSPIEDFSNDRFHEVIDDAHVEAKNVKRVCFCSGKLYYDLRAHQIEHKRNDVAIVRIEQHYPFPSQQIHAILEKYETAERFVWAQEEPVNMGAWGLIIRKLRRPAHIKPLELVARRESSTPATGYHKQHQREQEEIIQKVFNPQSM